MAARLLWKQYEMKENNINILSTRPVSSEVVAMATHNGIIVDQISFIETRSLMNETLRQTIISLASQQATILITSMNAATAVIDVLRQNQLQPRWTVFSLAGTTAKILREYFTAATCTTTAIDAEELAPQVVENKPHHVFFFCGTIRRDVLPKSLKESGIAVEEYMVYETIETPVKLEKDYRAVLFYSPSAVRSFFKLNRLSNGAVVFAIGATTANELKQFCNNEIIMSSFPSKEEMVKQAVDYLNQFENYK